MNDKRSVDETGSFDEKELEREVNLEEIKNILSKTIVHDDVSKLITFLAALLTYTDEDQVNVAFNAESSTGKSYIVTEVLKHFPKEDMIFTAYSSPTAFYHADGDLYDKDNIKIDFTQKPDEDASPEKKRAWKERVKNSKKVVDWEQKIVVFLDQPHDDLLKRLRPLLSHDMKLLAYRVTDKTGQDGLRTKTIYVKGYPTIFFCSSKVNIEDQERTRLFVLSPEETSNKIEDALRLTADRLGNRNEFNKSLLADHEYQWLTQRVKHIRETKIKNIIIPNAKEVVDEFIKENKHLSSRAQRDFPRLIALIKAHTFLNYFTRESSANSTIVANQTDVKAGFDLYSKIAQSNEIGLAPETYDFYVTIFESELDPNGLTKTEILRKYYRIYHRTLDTWRLERDILPALKSAGVIAEESDESDRRVKKYMPIRGGVKTERLEGFVGYYPRREGGASDNNKDDE
jgi:hypothetical protein